MADPDEDGGPDARLVCYMILFNSGFLLLPAYACFLVRSKVTPRLANAIWITSLLYNMILAATNYGEAHHLISEMGTANLDGSFVAMLTLPSILLIYFPVLGAIMSAYCLNLKLRPKREEDSGHFVSER